MHVLTFSYTEGTSQKLSSLTLQRSPYVGNKMCYNILNPLNPKLNPICYLLALLAHHFLHVSRMRVKSLTIMLLMSHIFMEHLFLMFLDHTQ